MTASEPLYVRFINPDGTIHGEGLDTTWFLPATGDIYTLWIAWGPTPASKFLNQFDITCDSAAYPPFAATCLIPNADFITQDNWSLEGSAVITDSILTLNSGGSAYQDLLTLAQDITYDVVISVTQVISGPVPLKVSLGSSFNSPSITEPGLITVTLTAPSTPSVTYSLQNQNPITSSSSIDIDFTCLSEGDDLGCLAPDNGGFETGDDWGFYRGAIWSSSSQNAFLPFNPGGDADRSLVVASSVYTMPALDPGQYLLVSFDARSEHNDDAVMGSRVTNGVDNTVEFYAQTYPTDYTFEYDISDLASEQVAIAFANAVTDPLTGFTGEDDAVLDNVCVFLSDSPPGLPTPKDPFQIPPTDLGFEFSCDDVDGFLASFGVNMQQYRATYATTPSIWDPEDWVPWLVAAFWVILETYICLFLGVVAALVNILEYIINNGLNIFSWFRRSSEGGITWWQAWLNWFRLTFASFSDFFNVTADDWLIWFGLSLAAFALFPGAFFTNLGILTLWFSGGLAWLWDAIKQLPLLGDGLNGIRSILNTLIGAWNFIWSNVGSVLSILIDLAVQLWNSSILPFFQLAVNFLSLYLILSSFGLVGVALFWLIMIFIWTKIFQTISAPLSIIKGFNQGIQAAAFNDLFGCVDGNLWCSIFAGFEIINQSVSPTVLYPIMIVAIVLVTIMILGDYIVGFYEFVLETVRDL